jgi:hypothetical protein
MLQDPFAYLALFDDLHETRAELRAIESSIVAKAKGIEQAADTVERAIQQWRAEITELGAQIGRDVHENRYVALETYVNEIRDDAKVMRVAAVKDCRAIADTAVAELRALATAQQAAFDQQLHEVAAAANGLPPLPPRPIENSAIALCTYHMKAAIVRVRRFCIEAKSVATVVAAVAIVVMVVQPPTAGTPCHRWSPASQVTRDSSTARPPRLEPFLRNQGPGLRSMLRTTHGQVAQRHSAGRADQTPLPTAH